VNQLFIVGTDGTALLRLTHLSGEMNPGVRRPELRTFRPKIV